MKLTLERKVVLGFGAALLALLLVGAVACINIARFVRTQPWVEHTRVVLGQLEQAVSHLLQMQATARGFVLTGSDEMLQPYEQAAGQLDRAIAAVRRLTAENAAQQARLDRLDPQIARARALMLERIAARRERGLAAAEETAAYLEGQRAVTAVRALLREMAATEQGLLQSRLDRTARAGRFALLSILGVCALSLLLGLAAVRQLVRDFRRRREAETALQESFARIEDLYHHAPCGYQSLDPDGRFLAINDTMLGWLGYTRDEVIGQKIFPDLLTAASAAEFAVRFPEFKRTGTVLNADYELRRRDGTVLPVLLNATAIYDDLGRYVASRATVFDVTERRRAERERDRFFTLTSDLLCVVDADRRFKRVNPAWESVLGYPAGELRGQPFLELVHPDDRERTLAEAARLREGGESVDFENRYRCRDGSYRWLQWSARTAPEENLIYASARDVTERRLADERIQKLNAALAARAGELEAINGELEAFSYSVSHDLRAPLRHIDGFASLLEKKLGDAADPETRRFLATIIRSTAHMGTLIENLLAFSRLGRTTLRRGRVDTNALVAGVIQDGHFARQHPAIEWQIAPLPEVHGDAALLRQVWVNLIENAVKYSGKKPAPRIAIATAPSAAGETAFVVRDNGAGFDMACADRLFGVFQRLHAANDFPGTGIGLANVRRIVARHGGRTWAEGRVDEGAAFYFALPAAPIDGAETGAPTTI